MISAEQLWVASGVALAAAGLPRGRQSLRATLALAGAAMAVWGGWRHHAGPVAVGLTLTLVNLVNLSLGSFQRRAAAFSDEERAMADRCFGSLPRPAFRQLIDMGLWIDGNIGETLIHQGRTVDNLFFLSAGEALVLIDGVEMARVGDGHFLGELTVLEGNPATAEVRLLTPARFWCIPADKLRQFIALNPAFGQAINAAFATDLRDKLRLANRKLAEVRAG